MASLQQKGNGWYCQFLYLGKRYTFAVGQVAQDEAESKAQQVDYLLMRLKQRLAVLPAGVGIVEYVRFDGKVIPPETPDVDKIELEKLRKKYIETHEASLEATTIGCIRTHFRHLEKILGTEFCIPDLTLADLQAYVDKRIKAKGKNGRTLSPTTVKKEIHTLRTVWRWAAQMNFVATKFPNAGLRFPKTSDKPPFMTRAEIDRRIAAGGLSKAEIADLWDSLYLTVDEIAEFLKHVKVKAIQPFVYPMVSFAAYTGARRSEILRVKVTDVDLDARTVLIHERKRVKGKLTTRRTPLSVFLVGVLKKWLAAHPGGQYLFCQEATVTHSKTRSSTTGYKSGKARPKTAAGRSASVSRRQKVAPGPLTIDEASDHLNRVLKDSKWDMVRGWHVCRHSMISACVSEGIDERILMQWVGHTSPEMQARYTHLAPNVERNAVDRVF